MYIRLHTSGGDITLNQGIIVISESVITSYIFSSHLDVVVWSGRGSK
jgi:hypothetical protein